MYFKGSGSHLDRVGCVLAECDRESASNTAIAGHSLTGSVASSYIGHQRLEVGADVHPRKKYSFSSERLSETVKMAFQILIRFIVFFHNFCRFH